MSDALSFETMTARSIADLQGLSRAYPALSYTSAARSHETALTSGSSRCSINGTPAFAKLYDDTHTDNGMLWECELLNVLGKQCSHCTFPLPINNIDGAPYTKVGNQYVVVSNYLDGIPLDLNEAADIRILSTAAASLHSALGTYDCCDRPGVSLFKSPFALARRCIEPYPLDPRDLPATHNDHTLKIVDYWNQEARELEDFYHAAYQHLPAHICHNDLTAGNVLKRGSRLSAVVDFEFACIAPRALDVAMGLRMSMKVWAQNDPWSSLNTYARSYIDHSDIVLTNRELECMPWLMRYRAAVSVLLRISKGMLLSDLAGTLQVIEHQRNMCNWMLMNNNQFNDTLHESFSR